MDYSYWELGPEQERRQAIRDAIKRELMLELQAQRPDLLSALADPKAGLDPGPNKKVLPRVKEQEPPNIQSLPLDLEDPHLKAIVNSLLREPNYIDSRFKVEAAAQPRAVCGPPWPQLSDSGPQQEQGLLYGVGAAALLGLLVPSFRYKAQSLFTRIGQEGIELLEKARSTMARAKEDIEDLIAEASSERYRH